MKSIEGQLQQFLHGWVYPAGGGFFGVPLSNSFGWLYTANKTNGTRIVRSFNKTLTCIK